MINETVFLDASVPVGSSYDQEITEATLAFSKALLMAGYKILASWHRELTSSIIGLAESEGFSDEKPIGIYLIHDTPEAYEADMKLVRYLNVGSPSVQFETQMFQQVKPKAGIFIGGDEDMRGRWETLGRVVPEAMLLPVVSTGGVAAELFEATPDLQDSTKRLLMSRSYLMSSTFLVKYLSHTAPVSVVQSHSS